VSSFVDLADRTRDPVLRRSLLLDAWRHAAEVAAGHDYALKHVAGGFIEARHFRDARTAIDEMRDPSIRMDYLAWLQRALADAERHEDAAKVAGELDRTLDEHPGIQSQSELLGHAEDLLKEDLPGMEPSDDAVFAELGAMVAAGSFDAAVAQIRHRFPTRFCPPVLSLPADLQTSTLVLQLETVATRRRNDLKVEFVCDLAAGLHGAGITLPDEAGAVLVSPALLALEPPATPPIMSRDLSQLTLAELVTLLFDRPVANTEEERRWMERTRNDDAEISDEAELVRLTTRLFRDFGTIASRYSPEQVDQGLWLLLSYPGDVQMSIQFNGVPEDAAVEWVEAAYHVFAGYVARRELPDSLTAFYMFWDLSWRHTTDAVRGAALRTLTRVLELPDRDCRVAACTG
jgi:hypothetical protein